MSVENLLVWIIIGALAGWVASIVMKTNRQQGLVADIIVGVIGGLLGGFILDVLNIGGDVTGLNVASFITAFIGAVIFLWIIRMVDRTT